MQQSNKSNAKNHGVHDSIEVEGEGLQLDQPIGFQFGRMFKNTAQHPLRIKFSVCHDIGQRMTSQSAHDRADSEIPAGYTYFGQFVDHDITSDTTERDTKEDPIVEADNLAKSPNQILITPLSDLVQSRSPSLDLDSLYGGTTGRDEALFVGSKFKIGFCTPTARGRGPISSTNFPYDLPRVDNPKTNDTAKKALIGDPRNDDNLAVAQIHLMWLKFHNHIIDVLKLNRPGISNGLLFETARDLVTRHYQYVVLHDFVRRMINSDSYQNIIVDGKRKHLHHGPSESAFMPLEFSVAAYRHGHSQVRESYDWNVNFGTGSGVLAESKFQLLFDFSEVSGNFKGAATLPVNWVVDYRRMFDFSGVNLPNLNGSIEGKLNFAKGIDPYLASDLGSLPAVQDLVIKGLRPTANLAALNLRRGAMRGLPSGQDISRQLPKVRMLEESEVNEVIDPEFQEIMRTNGLYERTPLWLYILLEAAVRAQGKTLGELGSTIVAETFRTLIMTSRTSILQSKGNWEPREAMGILGADEPLDTIPKIIAWIDQTEPLVDPLQDIRFSPPA